MAPNGHSILIAAMSEGILNMTVTDLENPTIEVAYAGYGEEVVYDFAIEGDIVTCVDND